jgi:Chlorophyll A-B binding protein
MKVVAALALAVSSASAFAPSSSSSSTTKPATSLSANPFGTIQPFDGDGMYVGNKEWELLTTKWGSDDTGKYMRASELKHGRSAMVAVVGFLFEKFGWTFDKISPHEYLSVSQGVKFADLAAMGPIEAIKAVPPLGMAQIFCTIAAIEIYELTHANGEIKYDERIAPGLQSGGLTGELGFNPLRFTMTDKIRLNEISNGRAAMVAIAAWVSHDAIPGSVPIPLPWN